MWKDIYIIYTTILYENDIIAKFPPFPLYFKITFFLLSLQYYSQSTGLITRAIVPTYIHSVAGLLVQWSGKANVAVPKDWWFLSLTTYLHPMQFPSLAGRHSHAVTSLTIRFISHQYYILSVDQFILLYTSL